MDQTTDSTAAADTPAAPASPAPYVSPEEEFARRLYKMDDAVQPPAAAVEQGEEAEDAEAFARRFYGMPSGGEVPDLGPSGGEVPDLGPTGDEELDAIRGDWTRYPAEVNKQIGSALFDTHVGQTVEVDGEFVQTTREMARKTVSEVRGIVGDLGLNREESSQMLEIMRGARPAGHSDETAVIAQREATVGALNQKHGQKAHTAFRAAQAYVAKNPFLGHFLEKSGLGDDPQMVSIIARKALALHERGKLRLK